MNPHCTLFINFLNTLSPIITAIREAGGITYLVGGGVRDLLLHRPLKDIDLEVHAIALNQLEALLAHFGHVIVVGKQFGVLRLVGHDIDWSLPRTDNLGRKPTVNIDPTMGITEACRRRDITMNAMAININDALDTIELLRNATSEDIFLRHLAIIDPFGGQKDMARKQLCAVDQELFLQDPLRFFRVMQFIGRFEMQPDQALNDLCMTMELRDAITHEPLARERIFEEIKKLVTASQYPSLGFRWLQSIDRLHEIFPELDRTRTIQQRPDYHPEGTVYEHTMQALDAAAQLPYYSDTEKYSSRDEKCIIALAVLCHDLGKIIATDAQLSTKGHDVQGVELTHALLKRLTDDRNIIDSVCTLVRYHMAPFMLVQENASKKAYKRLASKIAPHVTLRQLALVALADRQGRNPCGHEPLINEHHEIFKQFMTLANDASVAHGPEKPVLLGRHLLDVIPPGPQLGKALKQAYTIQIEEDINDPDLLRQRVLDMLSKHV